MTEPTGMHCGFRASMRERRAMEAAAHHVGETLSGFMRKAALDAAAQVIKEGGPDVLAGYDRVQQRRNRFREK